MEQANEPITHFEITPLDEDTNPCGEYTKAVQWTAMAMTADGVPKFLYTSTEKTPFDQVLIQACQHHPEANMMLSFKALRQGSGIHLGPCDASALSVGVTDIMLTDGFMNEDFPHPHALEDVYWAIQEALDHEKDKPKG